MSWYSSRRGGLRVSGPRLSGFAAALSACLIIGPSAAFVSAVESIHQPTSLREMSQMDTTCTGNWKAPKLALASGADALFNSVATSGNGRAPIYLMVNTLDAPVSKRPLRVLAEDGTDIGAPVGDFEFVYPQGAVDPDGTLHMVWGEPDSVLSRDIPDWMISRVRSLWMATYSPAQREWSAPTRLIKTVWAPISWTRANAVTWSRGRAMLAATVSLPDMKSGPPPVPPGYAILLELDSTWRMRKVVIPGQRHPGVASAMRLVDRLLIAIGGSKTNANSELRVVAVKGDSVSVELELPRPGQIEHVRILDDGPRGLHLVWKEAGRQGGSFLHVGGSQNGGLWSAALERAMGRSTGNERFAVDACGVVHATFEMFSDAGQPGLYEMAFAATWRSPEERYPGLTPRNADIVAFPNGTMMLAFQGSLSGTRGGSLIGRFAP